MYCSGSEEKVGRSNRLLQIEWEIFNQCLTYPQQWRFVPTKENPTDLVTRGLKVSELANSEKWWNGPEFLGNDESEWPINRVNVDQETKSMEIKRNDREFPK